MMSDAPRLSGISLQLSGDNSPTFMMPGIRQLYGRWVPSEAAEESFWKCAELNDDVLTISKLPGCLNASIGLMWLRFVPMSDAEVAAYKAEAARKDTKRVHAHTDLDWLGWITNYNGIRTLEILADNMAGSDVGVISVEIYPLQNDYSHVMQCIKEAGGIPPAMDPRLKHQNSYKHCSVEYVSAGREQSDHTCQQNSFLSSGKTICPIIYHAPQSPVS
jgi:hypothetical protein